MDEPLSNLDAKLRVQMRADIADLQARLGVTTVYVTHDQSEAMTLGHRVAVLRDGRLQQCAPPRELYDRPANAFVAGFIGSPAMSFVEVPLGGNGSVELAGVRVPCPAEPAAAKASGLDRCSSGSGPRRSPRLGRHPRPGRRGRGRRRRRLRLLQSRGRGAGRRGSRPGSMPCRPGAGEPVRLSRRRRPPVPSVTASD